jgi:hypothetical protein
MINEKRAQDKKITISWLAEFLGLERPDALERYFSAIGEVPTFSFLEFFADKVGLNSDWLKYGQGYPFESLEKRNCQINEYSTKLLELKPQEIIFMRCSSTEGQSGVIARLNEVKYVIFPSFFNVSSLAGRVNCI